MRLRSILLLPLLGGNVVTVLLRSRRLIAREFFP